MPPNRTTPKKPDPAVAADVEGVEELPVESHSAPETASDGTVEPDVRPAAGGRPPLSEVAVATHHRFDRSTR